MINKLAIIGGGSWGTALAVRLAQNAQEIHLWVFEAELCESLQKTRVNEVYLPGVLLPENVSPTGNLEMALDRADIVLTAIPSQYLRPICERMRDWKDPKKPRLPIFVSATKGLESGSLLRMSQVIEETLGPELQPRVAVLSGPTFAREVARGAPAAVVIAASDERLAGLIQREFANGAFRLYTNTDVVGVEMGAALKNVIAIAVGVCDGLGLGSNAVAALITRGLSEITRLACACGARRETLSGLTGLGDLVLTCTGAMSRNRSVGVEMGRGRKLPEILHSMRMVAEGINTTAVTLQLAKQKGIEMPITEQMYAVLYNSRSPQEAVRELMERTPKPE